MKRNTQNQQPSNIEHIPRTLGGVFLSPRIEVIDTEHRQAGSVITSQVTMPDGRKYKVVSAEPHDRATDIADTSTTAFGTQVNGGLNARMLDTRLELGIPSDQVSIEQSIGRHTTLSHAAHDQLEISIATAKRYERDMDSITVSGISRAAMIGVFINAVAPRHGISVLNNDWIAPCFPRAFSPIRDTKGVMKLMLNESTALAKGVLSLDPNTALKYVNTVDLSPVGVAQNLKAIPNIIGAATSRAIRSLPKETSGSVTLIEGDQLSQPDQWAAELKSFTNITQRFTENKGHFGIIHQEIFDEWLDRTEKSLGASLGQRALSLAI